MLCDACLMLLYTGFKGDETARRVFFALQVDDFPTIETLMKESGVSRHGVREALSCFRGAGLVWGNGCAGLSDSGQRRIEGLSRAWEARGWLVAGPTRADGKTISGELEELANG